jgi:hypothetical protein
MHAARDVNILLHILKLQVKQKVSHIICGEGASFFSAMFEGPSYILEATPFQYMDRFWKGLGQR